MKKYLIAAAALLLISFCAGAQTTRQHIVKALTHPKTSENAAKADALLIDDKRLMDSSQVEARPITIDKSNNKKSRKKKKGN